MTGPEHYVETDPTTPRSTGRGFVIFVALVIAVAILGVLIALLVQSSKANAREHEAQCEEDYGYGNFSYYMCVEMDP